LPEAAEVSLRVFDALGREVAELVRGRLASGSYESAFDAGSFGTGMYFYRLRAGNHTETRRMMLVK
jgi:glucuronoarabinoxylan endo-1,4-beta-xylanase